MNERIKGRFMAKKTYSYKENKTISKKISGVYDATTHTIESEGDKRDILKELEDFADDVIEISITTKEEIDLSNEE